VKIPASAGYAFSAAAALVIISACSGTTPMGGPPAALSQSHVKVRPNNVPHLFVSDLGSGPGSGVVQVFNYPNNILAFTLTGFNTPAGECVDRVSGDVYITDPGNSNIQEYSNGGAFIQTLNDPGKMPVACAVRSSPVYRVAVVSGNSPSITVYTGTGIPTSATYSTTLFSSIAYDSYYNIPNLRLYFDGIAGGVPSLGYMTQSGGFSVIAALPVLGPGGVQKVPGYLAIGDSTSNKVYRIQTSGIPAPNNPPTSPNPTVLSNSCSSFGDFYLQRHTANERTVINPETCMAEANEYKFPAGGAPGQHFTSPLIKPVGVVVSQ
jgi:hypothetical protein